MIWLLILFLSLLAASLWILTLLGMPGNWGLLALAAGVAYFSPDEHSMGVEIIALGSIFLLAVAGEVVEFFAGAAGVNQLGGSRKGSVLALLGSVVGAVVGLFVGMPIPIIGSLLAALFFGGLGAFSGAVAGERWDGKEWDLAIRIGWGALWGKLLGTLLKAICGTIALVILLVALWT